MKLRLAVNVGVRVLLVGALVVMGYMMGDILAEQREVAMLLDRRAELREAEIQQIHDDMEGLKREIREEIRTPAGERAETHEAARVAVEGMRALRDQMTRVEYELCGGPCPEVDD